MARTISDKIDNVVHLTPEFKTLTPPAPLAVKIDLTRTCNYKCKFCFHSQLDKNEGSMDMGLYRKIIDELKQIGVKEVAPFFFGESFLNPNLPEAIRYAKSAGFEYVFITTNGSVSTPDKIKACMEAGLNSIKFSLNYADQEQFAEVTRISPKLFEKVKANIRAAHQIREEGGYNCGLYASYIAYDGDQGADMGPILEEMAPYLDEVYALPLYNQADRIDIKKWEFTGGNQGRAANPVAPVPCWALFKEGHINFDGTVCACCFSVSDEFNMGDLNKQSFMEVWHGEKFQALRQAHLSNEIAGTICEGCLTQKNLVNEPTEV